MIVEATESLNQTVKKVAACSYNFIEGVSTVCNLKHICMYETITVVGVS